MNKEELEKKMDAISKERETLFDERDSLDKKILRKANQINKLKDKIAKIDLSQPMTIDKQIEYFLFEDGNVSGERYAARDKFFYKLFGLKGPHQGGYFQDRQQVAIQVKLTKNNPESLQNHVAHLTMLLPFIKPDKDGYKVFPIFEHTLSRHRSYSLHVNEKDKEYIIVAGSISPEAEYKNLADALTYIQKRHYYDEE